MKCPYCSREMELGYIRANRPALMGWLPRAVPQARQRFPLLSIWKFQKLRGAMLDSRMTSFQQFHGPESWHCPACRILITGPVDRYLP